MAEFVAILIPYRKEDAQTLPKVELDFSENTYVIKISIRDGTHYVAFKTEASPAEINLGPMRTKAQVAAVFVNQDGIQRSFHHEGE